LRPPRVSSRRTEAAERPELKSTRYLWLKDASNWTRAKVDLHWLRMSRCPTTRAWQLKEALRDLLQLRHQPNAPVILLLDRWINWAARAPAPVPAAGQCLRPSPRRH
jgi:hypothetical protein